MTPAKKANADESESRGRDAAARGEAECPPRERGQIDRLLKPCKAKMGARGRCGTKPGGLLKTQVPVRTDNWDIAVPGCLEAETVAHCGGSLEGNFLWSVTRRCVDPMRSARSAIECMHCLPREVEGALPVEVPGFD